MKENSLVYLSEQGGRSLILAGLQFKLKGGTSDLLNMGTSSGRRHSSQLKSFGPGMGPRNGHGAKSQFSMGERAKCLAGRQRSGPSKFECKPSPFTPATLPQGRERNFGTVAEKKKFLSVNDLIPASLGGCIQPE